MGASRQAQGAMSRTGLSASVRESNMLLRLLAGALLLATVSARGLNHMTASTECRGGQFGTMPGLSQVMFGLAFQYDANHTNGKMPLIDRTRLLNSTVGPMLEYYLWPNWTEAFTITMNATRKVALDWKKNSSHEKDNFNTIAQYGQLYRYFMDHYGDDAPQPTRGVVLKRGIGYDPNLTQDYRWVNDNIFGQERLMGNNPVQLQRVVDGAEESGRVAGQPSVGITWKHLASMLNTTYLDVVDGKSKFDQAIQEATGDMSDSISKAIARHQLYVLHYPLLAEIVGDVNAPGAYANRFMMAPIALFLSTHDDSYPLKPVAIQLGHTASSWVCTPQGSSFFWWTVAKLYVNNADGLVSQIVHHLVNAHLISESFAVSMHRKLPEQHPVYQILKFHFEGLIPINTMGFQLLTPANGSVSQIAGFGHKGLLDLIEVGYEHWTYEKMDFEQDLVVRGVDNQEFLQNYSFRDDGQLVHDVIKQCVSDYVDHYYCSEEDVKRDSALQEYVQDLYTQHPNKSMVQSLNTVDDLKTMLRRIIYINSVHHAAVNYAVREFGSSVVTIPFSTFKRPEELGNLSAIVTDTSKLDALVPYFLGDYEHASLQAETATQLASLRFSDLFAYGPNMTHASQPVKDMISRCRTLLVGNGTPKSRATEMSVEGVIERRNAIRKSKNIMEYAYMKPSTLPNSIAI
ncbi:polyunsaturated fatty acid 5-lipoxygenase-like [Sycon ciliatum]|uniref:polyunsaturated fatty acid 5-lipoxygenase-like n=1 Tax=Sycon ciliatum TaxID=27933 RepID=UPI0031F6A127